MTALDPDHAALMDGVYRHQRRVYDLTRAWYLLGRDRLIDGLAPPPGGSVLEIACGTGRNLDLIGRRHPHVRLHGLDISAQMLATARAKLRHRAWLARADACAFDPQALFDEPGVDRVFLSYSLSMIPDWRGALAAAHAATAPGARSTSWTSAPRTACRAGSAAACAPGSPASTSRPATTCARSWRAWPGRPARPCAGKASTATTPSTPS